MFWRQKRIKFLYHYISYFISTLFGCFVSAVVFCLLLLLSLLLLLRSSFVGVRIFPPLPRNLFPFIGSEVHNTCHFIGENGQPPLWVKFQKKKEPQNWMDIANTERVYQTNATHGKMDISSHSTLQHLYYWRSAVFEKKIKKSRLRKCSEMFYH